MKRNFFKTLLNGVIMGTVALIIICVGFYIFIKARNSSSTSLPMDTSNPTELYVNNNETLTAAKRNSLVSKANTPTLSQQYYSNNSLSTSSTTWADTDMTITTTTPAGHVLLLFNGSARNSQTSNCAIGFVFSIDGANVVNTTWGNTIAVPTDNQMKTVSATWLSSISAGIHTFKIRWRVQGGTAYLTKTNGDTSRQFQVIVLP